MELFKKDHSPLEHTQLVIIENTQVKARASDKGCQAGEKLVQCGLECTPAA